MRYRLSLFSVASVLAATLSTASSSAADFPERVTFETASRASGLAGIAVPNVVRGFGGGRDSTAWALMTALNDQASPVSTTNPSKIEHKKDYVFITGEGWYLQVFADGTKVRFRNDEHLRSSQNPVRLFENRPTLAELGTLGNQFISAHLMDFLPMGKAESLFPLHALYEKLGGQSADGKMDPERVAASAVVFSRILDGVPVIGPGSKVMVMFDNAGQATGFDIDWAPLIKVTGTQATMDLELILERQAVLSSIAKSDSILEVRRFECGYYDGGARRSIAGDPIQPACSSRYIVGRVTPEAFVTSGRIDVVPIGDSVVGVPWWPESGQLLATGDVCNATQQDQPLFDLIPGAGGGANQ